MSEIPLIKISVICSNNTIWKNTTLNKIYQLLSIRTVQPKTLGNCRKTNFSIINWRRTRHDGVITSSQHGVNDNKNVIKIICARNVIQSHLTFSQSNNQTDH